MANLSKGYTFGATETVTNAKLHALVDDGSVSGIVNADIAADASIDSSKIDLTSAGYMTSGGAATITALYIYEDLPQSGSTPTLASELITKDYADTKFVTLASDDTITGKKTFGTQVDFGRYEAKKFRLENVATDPATLASGQMFFRTDL